MLSGIAVWRLGTKYSTAKKVGYLILAKKLKIFKGKESLLFDLGRKNLSKWISLNSCNNNLHKLCLIQGLLTKQRQL